MNSEHGLTALLRKRFAAPEYAFLPQVRNQTGFGRTIRTADAVAMSLYPSRGLHLFGFEIKCSRSDWTRELKDPAKADEIAGRCHHWYIVAPSEKVVPRAELPPTWGLLIPSSDGLSLRTVQSAPVMEPKPLDYTFLAGILRKAAEAVVAKADIAKEIELARNEATGAERKRCEREIAMQRGSLLSLQNAVNQFTQRSGLSIHGYNGPHLRGEAEAAAAMRGEFGRQRANELLSLVRHIEGVLSSARTAAAAHLSQAPEPDWSI